MAHWSNVASGFDAEDETANFGARTVAEHDGSIYETWTRATIQCDQPELLREVPRVRASFSHSLLCIAVDKSVTVFANESCQEVVASVGFEALVTAHCLSSSGELLFVAVEGHVYGFNLTIRSQQVFTADLGKFDCETAVLVTLEEDEHTVDLIVVASTGRILRIRGIDGTVDEIINEACVKNAEVLGTTSKIVAATEVVNETREASIITLGEEVFLWPRRLSCSLKSLEYCYVKAQLFDSYPAMLCLRSDGCLSVVCRMTLLARKIWDGAVADFVAVKEKTEDYHMLVLMRAHDGEETTSLHLLSFPDFQVKFSMTVPRTTYLVELSGCVDHLIFLEGARNPAGVVDTIRIKAIEESMPEFRLQRLLRRRRFEEAHDFAEKFHLNAEVVFHAEAMMLMERSIGSAAESEAVDVEVFVKTLEKIRDVRFVYDCCKNAMTRSYRDTRRLITYARQRIVDHMNCPNYYTMLNDGHDVLSELLSYASDVLKKLETFEIIYTDSRDESIDEWRRFCRADLLDECIKHLSVGELDAAALIWNRHVSSISPRMNAEILNQILNSIPERLEPPKLWPWLRHFVPSVTSVVPSGLSDVIQWGYKKTKSLELHHRDTWPDIGLEFANGLIEMLQFEENNVFFQFHQQYANKNSQLHRLMMLVQAMSDLSELKHHYKVVLPLGTYMGDPTEVIHLLLNKVHIDGIPTLLGSFLQQYMLNHSLQNDQVLALYVQKTLKKSKGWWIWEKAPWDRRLSVVIGHIHNIQARLEQTLDVLKKAPVPWSDAVTALVTDSCRYDHPLVLQIRTESNSVAVKLILKKYGFAHIGLCTNLYHRIIRDTRSSMVADLLELTRKDPVTRSSVLSSCVHSYLKKGDVDGAIGILETLDEDVRKLCCKQIVHVFQARLTVDVQDETLENYVEVLGYVQRENCDTIETIPHLRAMYLLKRHFNISVKMSDFFRSKRQILKDYIALLIETGEFRDARVLRRVERVSDVLDFPRLMGVCVFLEETKRVEVVLDYVTDRISKWEVLTAEECHYANRICDQLVLEGEDEPELARALKLLCSRNLTNCFKEELPDVLQGAVKIDAYNEAVSQSLELPPKDSWSLYAIYRDASISAGDVLVPYLNDLLAIYLYHKNDQQSATHSDEEIQALLQGLNIRTRSIMNEHYDFAVLKILMSAHTSMCTLLPQYEDATLALRAVLTTCIPMMLKKVVDSIVFDLKLGLACLLLLPEEQALRLLAACVQNYQSDARRDRAVKELSHEYFRVTKNEEKMREFRSSRLLHHWAKRLAQCGIPYRDVLNSSLEERRSILCRVMTAKTPGTIQLLRDFCRSTHFDFRLGDCCLKYLEILLKTWEPKYTVGDGGLQVDTNEVKQLRAECRRAAAEVDDKGALKKLLTEAVAEPLLNFYHYEVYLIALELAEVSKVEWTSQLCFLQNYRRVAEPTDVETDAWLQWSQEAQLPPIAKWRLPFLPRIELFKFITPELTLKTYRQWLKIAPILSISIGSICTLTVRNAVAEELRNSKVGLSSPWSVNSRNSGLLGDIKRCLECMPIPERLEYGTASLYYVVNHTPPGADLVAAARECYLYMEEWKRACPDANFPISKFRRIREKYMRYTSEHILHTHGLGVDKYLGLVERPQELIVELYKDESIPQRYKSATRSRPDINSAVNALGELWALNLSQIRSNLLGEWLQPDVTEAKNDSVTAIFREDTTADSFSTDDNLLRACYIVGSGDTDVFITYLVHVGFDEKEDYNPGVRYRALRVIQSLTDEATLQSYTKINAQQFNQHMRSLRYLTELQRLGIGYSVNGFEACSKQKLAQVLVNSQYGAARALALVPQLFVDFDFDNFDLLDAALQRMVELALLRELKRALMMLNNVDRLVNCPGYISAWQLVVSESFNRLDARASSEALAACTEALRLLHACPVVDKLQFREIIAACFRAHQLQIAAALLPFLDEDDRSDVLDRIATDGVDVIGALEDLAKSGILIARQSVMILETSRSAPPPGS